MTWVNENGDVEWGLGEDFTVDVTIHAEADSYNYAFLFTDSKGNPVVDGAVGPFQLTIE